MTGTNLTISNLIPPASRPFPCHSAPQAAATRWRVEWRERKEIASRGTSVERQGTIVKV